MLTQTIPSRAGRHHESSADATSRTTVVIVGNGPVGFALCRQLVTSDAGGSCRIIVFGDEPRPAYDRVNLTQYFSGRTAADLELAPREWYETHGIELHTGDPVLSIDRERQLVRSRSREVHYDRLVLATGSRPFVPEIEGIQAEGVFVYRTIEDLEAIRGFSAGARRAAVLGGGLLGLEAARALHDLGLETHIIEVAPALMPRQLDSQGAALLLRKIEQLGVRVHLLKRTERIAAEGPKRILCFSDGGRLDVELIVVSAGIRPRDELARACGLACGPRGGIAVNDRLQTSDPRVFAIGECVLHRDVVYGLAAPGYRMAEVTAANLLGVRDTFEGGKPASRLKLLGVEVCTLGEFLPEDGDAVSLQSGTEETYRKLVLRRRRLVGAVLVGPAPELPRLQEAVDRTRRLWPWQVSRFLNTGTVWRPAAVRPVTDWPATAIVCSCTGVTRGTLTLAQTQGCRTVQALIERTGASTICGSCLPLLQQLTGGPSLPQPNVGATGLQTLSLIALLLLIAMLLAGPIPLSQTVQGTRHVLDALWRDPLCKQVTGFTLLGLLLPASLLSLRKRWKRFTFGEFGYWRVLHAGVGVTMLLGLAAHTGWRLGSHLNFWLMITFLAVNGSGALTGFLTSCEGRLAGPADTAVRRWRPRLTRLHIWLCWPLPVLLLFHVVTVYYF